MAGLGELDRARLAGQIFARAGVGIPAMWLPGGSSKRSSSIPASGSGRSLRTCTKPRWRIGKLLPVDKSRRRTRRRQKLTPREHSSADAAFTSNCDRRIGSARIPKLPQVGRGSPESFHLLLGEAARLAQPTQVIGEVAADAVMRVV